MVLASAAATRRLGAGVVPALAGAAVLAEVCYPLVQGGTRNGLTIITVALFAATSLTHCAVTCGRRAVAVLAVTTVVGGFAVEVLGVHTGVPFGRYGYAGSLGPRLFGVPVVIALAWPMLAWPAALVARRLASAAPARVAVGAVALAAWDLFLDPQMVAAGHWHWHHPDPHLPGVSTVPLTDYAGWLLVAALMSAALQAMLHAVLGQRPVDDRWPIVLYVWTWASSALALAVFLHLAAAAAWGALAMGLVAVPLIRSLRRRVVSR